MAPFLNILKKTGGLMAFYSVFRLFFLVYNFGVFSDQTMADIIHSFILGLRFDLATVFTVNFLSFAMLTFPAGGVTGDWLKRLGRFFFVFLNALFVLPSVADFEFYKFSGARLTWEILLFRNEAAQQMGQYIVNYWHLFLMSALMIYIILRLNSKAPESGRSSVRGFVAWLIFLILMVVGARGGLQMKPLQPAHAFELGNTDLGILTLNSTFTVIRSQFRPELKRARYFSSPDDMSPHLAPPSFESLGIGRGQNVVILIVESLASEFWGATNPEESFTPFLDSLVPQGLIFKYNFANGRRSIDALPAVLFGIPALMSTPIFKSSFQNNKWVGLGTVLKKAGYHTSFFHGAKRGTMYFDAISQRAGLEDYYPLERFRGDKERDYDGHWGIYDEPMLQFMVHEISTHPRPFFSVAFTISTHQPYRVPPGYEGRFPKGTLDIHQSVGYVDHSLRRFFESASREPWYKNTLFIITADHTQMSASKYFRSLPGRFRVPLFFFHPNMKLNTEWPRRVTQHSDIYPSVLDFLGVSSEKRPLFGSSVFSFSDGSAVFYGQGAYWFVKDQHFLEYIEGKGSRLFAFPEDMDQKNPLPLGSEAQMSLELELRARLQHFRNGLMDNDLF